MAFHLGVLRFLAERQGLEKIERLSTVSGGSLLIGLILAECNYQWPSSEDFLARVHPALRSKLTQRSLQWGAVRQLTNPCNFRFLLSRANLLAEALRREWNITGNLSEIGPTPEWSINGTTAETGRRFRFKQNNFGEYTIGYATAEAFSLAKALAVSAAFPGGFGPLTLKMSEYSWKKRERWDAPENRMQPVDPSFPRLRLYDGGIYDNLGLEPFFDVGKGRPKRDDEVIVASDAGAPLHRGFSSFALSPWRLKRVADIMSEQSRALRVRAFAAHLIRERNGAYISINPPDSGPCSSTRFAAEFPTTLRKLTTSEFDILSEHGYCVTEHVGAVYGLPV